MEAWYRNGSTNLFFILDNFSNTSFLFTPGWGILMYLISWRKQNMPIVLMILTAISGGLLFGLIMAIFLRGQAKKHNLPAWKEFGNP
jgi:RsiW-degrading membrane proteinase PrsW (M82 family)